MANNKSKEFKEKLSLSNTVNSTFEEPISNNLQEEWSSIDIETQAKRKKTSRASETDEQREVRLKIVQIRTSQVRSSETDIQREVRLDAARVCIAKTRSSEGDIQREVRLETAQVRTARSRRSLHIDLNLGAFNYNPNYNNSLHPSIDIGKMDKLCMYCCAFKFKTESPEMCCASGKVKLPELHLPVEPLLTLVLETHRSYDALQYPILFWQGEDEYHFNIKLRNPQTGEETDKKVSAMKYYSYRLMIRDNIENHILKCRQLFHQYIVDMYAKIETERLLYIRLNQTKLRSEEYINLRDAVVNDGNVNPNKLGKMIILPSTFSGSPRHMHDVNVFGETRCWMYSIEWQKVEKITPDQIDQVISAEIPDVNTDPDLFQIVTKNMIHGPCGLLNYNSPCMSEGKCTKRYPRDLLTETITGNDGYPLYRRRSTEDGGKSITLRLRNIDVEVDNRWVIPYLPLLLKTYKAHINVEYCNSVKSIKYICKYVNKGSDMAVFGMVNATASIDEIDQYQLGRYISSNEAIWRILSFPIHERHPTVVHLSVHLENGQRVYFTTENAHLRALSPPQTTLTAFFSLCRDDMFAKTLLYSEVPTYFTWNTSAKKFQRRKQGKVVEGHPNLYSTDALGRLFTVHPNNAECFYLRLLLRTWTDIFPKIENSKK
ncbi:unnamed protein product [Brassicogethes aeneus]|uniref:Helitron helicase-like domain-containing protein n=1 Tax=Brassicogethes aeneus TaxID=1431903 RepID=A0A9P0B3U8_BRAAE|nr:unnamed protein product [Brassicogethes aeneus]